MTEHLTCITNSMTDIRPCIVRDEHYPDYHHDDEHLRTCNGCIPRRAAVGMVCGACYNRIEEALQVASAWFPMLEGVDHAVRRDSTGGTGKFHPNVPIPPVPLTFEELLSYHRSFTGTAERWVASRQGAEDAVRFARAMSAAARNHPTEETAHKIRRTRCPECELLTLVWNPPQYLGGQVRVACTNPDCTYEADQAVFESIADIESASGKPISKRVVHEQIPGSDECSCGAAPWLPHVRALMAQEAA